MTTQSADATTGPGTIPARRVVATYDTYAEAERAVDYLSDHEFPVQRTSIVGRGLHFVEQITGRMTYGQAAFRGALTGAVAGALIGWLFGVFDWFHPLVAAAWLAFDGLWFGAIVGALVGLLAHAVTGGRRDFSSVGTMKADTYELLVDDAVAADAERLLAELRGAAAAEPTPEPAPQA